jgi:hypothetical protein
MVRPREQGAAAPRPNCCGRRSRLLNGTGVLDESAEVPEEASGGAAALRKLTGLRVRADRILLSIGVPFFLVACMFTYYGQFNRVPSGDTYGTIYTAVAIVDQHTIWLDSYAPYIEQHSGEHPYMLTAGSGGHIVNATPSAASLAALPVVALFTAAGAKPQDWHTWMEAGMLTAALMSAACVALMFVLLTRLTTRRRAALIAAAFAWGTLEWGISSQALWEHTGACLVLTAALLALLDRRLVLAGLAVSAMVAFRPSTPIIALLLLPLVGRRLSDWVRFVAGMLPFVLPLAVYNLIAFGSPLRQGYGMSKVTSYLDLQSGRFLEGLPTLLFSPGRGLAIYSPVLMFAIFGAVRGWRTPLYRWSALAALAYAIVAANDFQWWGGESFGPRKLTEVIPLLTVLLVPAIDAIVRSKWLWVFGGLLAWSVFVELLGAAASPASAWFDRNPDLAALSTWWNPTNNELVAKLETAGLASRMVAITLLFVLAIALGLLATRISSRRHDAARAPAAV